MHVRIGVCTSTYVLMLMCGLVCVCVHTCVCENMSFDNFLYICVYECMHIYLCVYMIKISGKVDKSNTYKGFSCNILFLTRMSVTLVPCYVVGNKGRKNKDTVRFSRRFNGSQNKGYLYAASIVGRKETAIELRRNYSS